MEKHGKHVVEKKKNPASLKGQGGRSAEDDGHGHDEG